MKKVMMVVFFGAVVGLLSSCGTIGGCCGATTYVSTCDNCCANNCFIGNWY